MRVLIYGFGPYRDFQENITATILPLLPKRRSLKKVVFPVRFNKGQFTGTIKAFNPDVILGLGQCSKGRLLRIESVAVNKRRNNKGEKAKPIIPGGARLLSTNLNLDLRGAARFSRNAGDYVCNYSMYVILDFLKRRRFSIQFGFIHIPYRYDVRKAVRLLVKATKKFK
jgi:pyrrolidone-carboxylate peptidase